MKNLGTARLYVGGGGFLNCVSADKREKIVFYID
jgi:hypothetical protein